jgi:hypothetical protein
MFHFGKRESSISKTSPKLNDYMILQSILDESIQGTASEISNLEKTIDRLTNEIGDARQKISECEKEAKRLQKRRKAVNDAITGGKGLVLTNSELDAVIKFRNERKDACAFISVDGGKKVEVVGDIVIGRSRNCDVVISDLLVSRKHAAIRRRDDGFYLEDLGSTNGTVLQGNKIPKSSSVKLDSPCVVTVGAARISFSLSSSDS